MTEKQQRFVDAFLGPARFNATAAARLAGYRWPDKQGSTVARHPAVKPAIEAGFELLMKAINAKGPSMTTSRLHQGSTAPGRR